MFKKIRNKIICSLIFIIFFNLIFLNVVFSMSMSMSADVPSDRVRTYEQQLFTYSQYEGFNCRSDGIIRLGDSSPRYSDNTGIETESPKFFDLGFATVLGLSIIKNLMTIVKCGLVAYNIKYFFLSSVDNVSENFSGTATENPKSDDTRKEKAKDGMFSSNSSKQSLGAILAILAFFLDGIIDDWIGNTLGTTDYLIDTTNSNCDWIKHTNVALCTAIMITTIIIETFVRNAAAIAITVGVMAIVVQVVDTVILALTTLPYKVASINFHSLSLCGDEWLVVGNDQIEGILLKSPKITSTKFILNKKNLGNFDYQKSVLNSSTSFYGTKGLKPIEIGTIGNDGMLPIKYYPTLGDFTGSYKRLLDECFKNRKETACKKIFPTKKDDETIDEYFKYSQKKYREFVYNGMEYEYKGCTDPRPERRNYSLGEGQLYYFRGTMPANFACERFLVSGRNEYKEAYRCCLEASQNKVCIKNKWLNNNVENEEYTICDKDSDGKNDCKLRNFVKVANENQEETCKTFKGSVESSVKILEEEKKKTEKAEEIERFNKSIKDIEDSYDSTCDSDFKLKSNDLISSGGGTSPWDTIGFKIRRSLFDSSKYCVETKTLCPYNFNIAGGSEYFGTEFFDTIREDVELVSNGEKDQDGNEVYIEKTYKGNEDALLAENKSKNCTFFVPDNAESCAGTGCKKGVKSCNGLSYSKSPEKITGDYYSSFKKPSNFCQIDRHCVYIEPLVENEIPVYSPYIDKSCFNMVGSSHNFENYQNIGNLYSRIKNSTSTLLTAPIAECMVETFRNLLLNTAGHTRCTKAAEVSDDDKSCASGVEYIRGETIEVAKFPSPFIKLKDMLQKVVKALMALMFVLYGFNLLTKKEELTPKSVSKKIFILIFVSYMSASNNWIRPVFKTVFGIINYTLNKSMEISLGNDNYFENYSFSGCYFFKNNYINNNYADYGDKNYLATFDTFDCKVATYLGFLNGAISAPPILGIIVSSILTFGVIIWLLFPMIMIFVALILFAVKIAYIFISANLLCCILLFAAPIMIPLILFDKTKGMFDGWLKQIEKTFYSSIFLVMGLNLFLFIFDKTYIGDAKFVGEKMPIRDSYCGKICKITNTTFFFIGGDDSDIETDCKSKYNGVIVDLSKKAPICFFTARHEKSSTNFPVWNYFIDNVLAIDSIFVSATIMFNIFLEVVFLMILLYFFDHFITYASEINEKIFEVGFKGGLMSASGLPSLKEVASSVAGIMSKLSNYGSRNNPLKKIPWKKDKTPDKKTVQRDAENSGGSLLQGEEQKKVPQIDQVEEEKNDRKVPEINQVEGEKNDRKVPEINQVEGESNERKVPQIDQVEEESNERKVPQIDQVEEEKNERKVPQIDQVEGEK